MTEIVSKTHDTFILPSSLVTRVDVSRLVSEVERVDNDLNAAMVRAKTGAPAQAIPVLSQQLADFLSQNQLDLNESRGRSELIKELRILKDQVPVIHMTFAVSADRESLQQLAQWLRTSIHPQALMSVGLQPALVAGVYMRTPNHVHDFSLRAVLAGKRESLVKELESYNVSK